MIISLHSNTNDDAGRIEFNDHGLRKHGISRLEALQVIEAEGSEYFPLSPRNDNDRIMFVGFSYAGTRLLEVGVAFLPGNRERIFHANRARRHFVNMYNQRKRI
jgi:hypothetical protein